MNYIIHTRFKGISLCGLVNLPHGTRCDCSDGILYYADKPLCAVTSQNAKEHFARDDDGHGLERGQLTHWIAFKALVGPNMEKRRELVCTEYARFLRKDCDYILFNDRFFAADIEVLREMKKRLEAIHCTAS